MRGPQVWSSSMNDVPLAVLIMRLRVFIGPIIPGSSSFSNRWSLPLRAPTAESYQRSVRLRLELLRGVFELRPLVRREIPFQYLLHPCLAQPDRNRHAQFLPAVFALQHNRQGCLPCRLMMARVSAAARPTAHVQPDVRPAFSPSNRSKNLGCSSRIACFSASVNETGRPSMRTELKRHLRNTVLADRRACTRLTSTPLPAPRTPGTGVCR